jgi:hypothetical protein
MSCLDGHHIWGQVMVEIKGMDERSNLESISKQILFLPATSWHLDDFLGLG